jgi:hypothetical protein
MQIASQWRRIVIVAVVVTIGAAAWLIDWKDVRVRYHDHQMRTAFAEQFENQEVSPDGLVGFEVGKTTARYEYHRDRLVELGAVIKRHYEFRHLRVSTPESNHFNHVLLKEKPVNAIDWSSKWSPPEDPIPMEYTVWCYPQDSATWDAYFAEHDVPDYRRRFMVEAK